ncbi:M1 family aminopeptidase [Tenacibaculum ascidiaceicola]|uniref:M1 family metallopeptidase n=1 Tax=Tenacibaculum ascidiaceicola TaxID=1699411 RepID=UPI0039EA147E
MNKQLKIMYKYLLFFCLSLSIACKKEQNKLPKITNGISLELAQFRKQQVSDVVYNLNFSIPLKKEDPIPSELKINLNLTNTENDLILDFNEKTDRLKSIQVNKINTPIVHTMEHIIINKDLLKSGENTIDINFDAGELSLNRNKEYLYTLLVPDRASTLFPCFDQPNIKTHYNLTITAPKDWKVLCGAFEKQQLEKGDFIEHQFKQTDKMSTYLFSFVAGKFNENNTNPGAFNMRFLFRESDSSKIKESLAAIFNTHQNSLEFLEEYTQYKFPFQKMDFASLPPFQYGGMEHTGAIQYRESSLFLDGNATQTRKLNRAKLIAHETSHMWFGNLVTMRWFNDVWMKEVFANFMADKIMNPVFPEINHDLGFMMSHYPSAYSEDRTKGSNPIRQQLDNLKNAGSLYGRIIYNKAPIMMRQLELLLGKENFQKGTQQYIATYANDNADWNDLVTIFDNLSPKDIKQWSKVWVNSPSRPIISDSISYNDGKISTFNIHQKAEDKSNNTWEQSFAIGLVYKDEIKTIHVDLNKHTNTINEAIGLPIPKEIIYNYNGLGYGIFPLNTTDIHLIKNDVARGHSYINLYENMLHGNITPLNTFNLFLKGIQSEKNELIVNYLSRGINAIFWKFLPKEQHYKLLNTTESTVFKLLQKELPKNIKKTLFNLYCNLAYNETGKENLFRLWNKTLVIDNLTLNETDLIKLATKLSIYKHAKSEEINKQQLENIKNKDKKERFLWLLPTLSNNEKLRDDFMLSLKEAKNREKESWVEAALASIHHPLRQKSSIKHLKLCLDLLEEIQLTGDIFFPKNWLTSSLGNYTSKEANEIVQEFLNKNKNYNPILLKKLLIVVDDIDRAQHKIKL